MEAPQVLFQQRQAAFAQIQQTHQRQYNRLAVARFGVFLGGLLGLYFLAGYLAPLPLFALAALPLAGYLALLDRHQRVRRQRDEARFLAVLNADEAARLQGQFTRPETGLDFDEPLHPYTADLDVFGPRSLFRLLNRTHTHAGAHTLAGWLKAPGAPTEIEARQQALRQLAPRLDWRQHIEAAAGLHEAALLPADALLAWAKEPDNEQVNQLWFRVVRYLPVFTALVVVGWLGGWVPGLLVLGLLVLHGLALGQLSPAATRAVGQTQRVIPALLASAGVLQGFQKEEFTAPKLLFLQKETEGAAPAVRALSRTLGNLSYRQNPYFVLLVGLLTLWDLQHFAALEAWRRRYRAHLPRWLAAVGELEALNSLAGLAFAEPGFVFPTIEPLEVRFEAQGLGHPLLGPEQRVTNDLRFGGAGHTLLVTGSNMSGKSTFLRTVGTNAVLALAGSVVCAQRLRLSPLRVFTSMRTQDSLEESTSSFYAELKRLRQLLETVGGTGSPEERTPVLYLLDEILKGTNSRDRHAGARGLLFQLKKTSAFGLISTHDVALGDEAAAWDFVENRHFRSDLAADGRLYFDYTLRPGVCHSFNAAHLMRQMGIEVWPD